MLPASKFPLVADALTYVAPVALSAPKIAPCVTFTSPAVLVKLIAGESSVPLPVTNKSPVVVRFIELPEILP